MVGIEPIEARRLFAAATAVLGNDGTLVVTGTSASEKIVVAQPAIRGKSTQITVNVDTASDGNTVHATLGSFDLDKVKRIEVRAGAKKDSVRIEMKQDIPTLVDGGQGNDDLRTSRGHTTLQGGAGDDQLYSIPTGETRPARGNTTSSYFVNFDGSAGTIVHPIADTKVVERLSVSTSETKFRELQPTQGTFTGTISNLVTLTGSRLLIDASFNQLDGGDGDDTLYSRGGEDNLVGGAGEDRYVPLNAKIEARLSALPTATQRSTRESVSRVGLTGIELISDNSDSAAGTLIGAAVSVRTSSLND